MKYCVHYHRNSPFRYFDELDEIEINYRKEDLTLPDFLEKYSSKTIVITVEDIEGVEAIDRLSNLYTKYKNFKVKINLANEEIVNAVMASGIPYFFTTLIDSWDLFIGVIALHPTDVYIVNELGFELNKVAEIAHNKNISIRVFPNVAQASWEKIPDIKKFFIRPDDIYLYEPYVDVMEFYGHEQQLSVYYEVYAHDRKWFGKLNEIINDFDSEMDSRGVVPAFATHRIKCGKRCLKGGACQICERTEHLAKTLEDQSLLIRVDKK